MNKQSKASNSKRTDALLKAALVKSAAALVCRRRFIMKRGRLWQLSAGVLRSALSAVRPPGDGVICFI